MNRTKDSAAPETRGSDPAEARARRLERVVGTIRGVRWVLDERGNTLAVSDPVGALLGLPPAEIIAGGSERFWSRIHDADRDMVAHALAAMFEGTRAFDVEFRERFVKAREPQSRVDHLIYINIAFRRRSRACKIGHILCNLPDPLNLSRD